MTVDPGLPAAPGPAPAERRSKQRLTPRPRPRLSRRRPEPAPEVLELFAAHRQHLRADFPDACPSPTGQQHLDRLYAAETAYVAKRARLDIRDRQLRLFLKALGGCTTATTALVTVGQLTGRW